MSDPQNPDTHEGDDLLEEATGGAGTQAIRPQGFGDGINVGPGGTNPAP